MNAETLIENNQAQFAKLYELYSDYNSHTNISSIRDKAGVYAKHFSDSLFVASYINQAQSIIDIGCGGGFPVLPLAICFPDKKFVALDSVGKKIKFIDKVCAELELENIETKCLRAEELAHHKNYRERFDIALSRAVAELRILLEYCVPFVKTGGKFVAFKNLDINDEEARAKNAMQALKLKLSEEKLYKLDVESERKLMIFEKKAKTSSLYPRDPANIKSNPL